MGTWGYGIFDDDTALDIKLDFEEYIEEGLSIARATENILEEYQDGGKNEKVYLSMLWIYDFI